MSTNNAPKRLSACEIFGLGLMAFGYIAVIGSYFADTSFLLFLVLVAGGLLCIAIGLRMAWNAIPPTSTAKDAAPSEPAPPAPVASNEDDGEFLALVAQRAKKLGELPPDPFA